MLKSPSTSLLRRGKGHFLFQEEGTTGYRHLGNIPKFDIAMEITEDPHYSSMAGEKLMDLNDITEKGMTATFDLEEISADNVNLSLLGDSVVSGSQSASALNGVSTTTSAGLYVSVGKTQLTYTRIALSASTGDFAAGDTITGDTSSDTATVIYPDNTNDILYCISDTGLQVAEGITSTAKTGTISSITVVSGMIVCDAATATVMYTAGTDYHAIPEGGMISEISGGSIAANTCYVSADYPALNIGGIRVLADVTKIGAVKYIGTNSTGPKWNMDAWRCQIKGGSFSLISEDRGVIPVEMKFLADTANHPDEPFCHFELQEVA